MHQYFADWYSRASVASSHEMLALRWEGVEKLAKDAKNDHLPNIVRVYLRVPTDNPSATTEIRNCFKQSDAGFLMNGNDNELSVLAGAGLIQSMDVFAGAFGDIAALAVLSSYFLGLGRKGPFEDVITRARAYVTERWANRGRMSDGLPHAPALEPVTKQLKALKTQVPQGNVTQIGETVHAICTGTIDVIKAVTEQVSGLSEAIATYREEANIAWWVVGESSRDLEQHVSEVGPAASPLVFGKELCDLTEVLPGIPTASSFLSKMLKSGGKLYDKPVAMKQAVNATTSEWRSSLIATVPPDITDLMPIIFAVKASLEVDKPEQWPPLFEKKFAVKSNISIAPRDLAQQVYLECLFARAVTEGRG